MGKRLSEDTLQDSIAFWSEFGNEYLSSMIESWEIQIDNCKKRGESESNDWWQYCLRQINHLNETIKSRTTGEMKKDEAKSFRAMEVACVQRELF